MGMMTLLSTKHPAERTCQTTMAAALVCFATYPVREDAFLCYSSARSRPASVGTIAQHRPGVGVAIPGQLGDVFIETTTDTKAFRICLDHFEFQVAIGAPRRAAGLTWIE